MSWLQRSYWWLLIAGLIASGITVYRIVHYASGTVFSTCERYADERPEGAFVKLSACQPLFDEIVFNELLPTAAVYVPMAAPGTTRVAAILVTDDPKWTTFVHEMTALPDTPDDQTIDGFLNRHDGIVKADGEPRTDLVIVGLVLAGADLDGDAEEQVRGLVSQLGEEVPFVDTDDDVTFKFVWTATLALLGLGLGGFGAFGRFAS